MKRPNFFGRWSVKISKFRPNFPDYISTFSLKEVPKFFLDKMHSHFRPERTKVVRRRRVSLVLFLIFFVTFLKRREVSCVWFQSSRFLKNDLFRIISRWCDEKSRYLYFLSFFCKFLKTQRGKLRAVSVVAFFRKRSFSNNFKVVRQKSQILYLLSYFFLFFSVFSKRRDRPMIRYALFFIVIR